MIFMSTVMYLIFLLFIYLMVFGHRNAFHFVNITTILVSNIHPPIAFFFFWFKITNDKHIHLQTD